MRFFQICVKITQRFIDYISTQPVVFEVFGHFSNHPLHEDSHDVQTYATESVDFVYFGLECFKRRVCGKTLKL